MSCVVPAHCSAGPVQSLRQCIMLHWSFFPVAHTHNYLSSLRLRMVEAQCCHLVLSAPTSCCLLQALRQCVVNPAFAHAWHLLCVVGGLVCPPVSLPLVPLYDVASHGQLLCSLLAPAYQVTALPCHPTASPPGPFLSYFPLLYTPQSPVICL